MAGIQPGLLLVDGFVVEGLGVFDLSVGGFDARGGGNGHQIGVSDGQHNQFTRVFVSVLRGFQALGGGAFLLEVAGS